MTGAFEVIDPGMLLTVQDRGRPGYAHLGVPRSGALDQGALALANRLVGNPGDAAALEVTLTGCVLRARGTQVVAVTGAFAAVEVAGRPAAWGQRLVVPDGAELRVGPAQQGARSMLALAGGVAVVPVLGSRSSDILSGIGPARLVPGDVVPAGRETVHVDSAANVMFSAAPRQIRLLPGPSLDWCEPQDVVGSWVVGVASNRVGLRLEGSSIRRRPGEIPSMPVTLGAVQLPPSGEPIVLLADHATTGGYPVIAVVAAEHIDACGQLKPGDAITTSWR